MKNNSLLIFVGLFEFPWHCAVADLCFDGHLREENFKILCEFERRLRKWSQQDVCHVREGKTAQLCWQHWHLQPLFSISYTAQPSIWSILQTWAQFRPKHKVQIRVWNAHGQILWLLTAACFCSYSSIEILHSYTESNSLTLDLHQCKTESFDPVGSFYSLTDTR